MELADKLNLLHATEREADDGRPRLFLRVPFEARDSFKAVFSGLYEWHPGEKLWSLPPAQRARLGEWIALAHPIREPSALSTVLHLTEREIEQTREEIEEQRAKLGDINAKRAALKASRATLAESRKILNAERDSIELAAAELAHDEREEEEQRAAVEAALSHLRIDLTKLRAVAAQMTLIERDNSRRALDRWNVMQMVFVRAKNALADAGLALEAITHLADYKLKARAMPPGAWHRLTRLEG